MLKKKDDKQGRFDAMEVSQRKKKVNKGSEGIYRQSGEIW